MNARVKPRQPRDLSEIARSRDRDRFVGPRQRSTKAIAIDDFEVSNRSQSHDFNRARIGCRPNASDCSGSDLSRQPSITEWSINSLSAVWRNLFIFLLAK